MATRIHVGSRESITRAGGMHNYILGLAAGQISMGHDVSILDQVTSRGGYNVFRGDGDLTQLECAETSVHLHFAYSALPLLARSANVRKARSSIMHFHGPWYAEGVAAGDSRTRALGKWIIEALTYWRGHEKYITASKAFAAELTRGFGVRVNKIEVVYPGVDTHRFALGDQRAARRALGLEDVAGPVFACVRRLERRMGIENAISAIARRKDVTLIIAGTGSLESELKVHAKNLGVADRVKFLGRVHDDLLPCVFQAADCSLVPTTALEGFGLVVLESMACGTPVISTRCGGLVEAQGPFWERWSIEDARPSALSSAIQSVVSSLPTEALRGELRSYAESRSLMNMAAEVEEAIL